MDVHPRAPGSGSEQKADAREAAMRAPEEAKPDGAAAAEAKWVKADPGYGKAGAIARPCSAAGCSASGTKDAGFRVCSGCRQAWYCSKNCQFTDWSAHKSACEQESESGGVAAAKEVAEALAVGRIARQANEGGIS